MPISNFNEKFFFLGFVLKGISLDVDFPEEQTIGLDSFIFNSCGTNVGQYGPYKEECVLYYENLGRQITTIFLIILSISEIILFLKGAIIQKWTCLTGIRSHKH